MENGYLGIRQVDYVRDYRNRFETFCLNSTSLLGQHLEAFFLQGLKPRFQYAIRQLQPNGILHMMDLAQWIEEANEFNSRRSTREDTREQRSGARELMILRLRRLEDQLDGSGVYDKLDLSKQNNVTGHMAWDPDEGNTFRVKGLIGKEEVKEPIKVTLENGIEVDCLGKCKAILIYVQEVPIVEDYLLLNLPDMDVILGYSWLASLGDTWIDWQKHTLSFLHNQDWTTIKGKEGELKQLIKKNHQVLLHKTSKVNPHTKQHLVLVIGASNIVEEIVKGADIWISGSEVETRKVDDPRIVFGDEMRSDLDGKTRLSRVSYDRSGWIVDEDTRTKMLNWKGSLNGNINYLQKSDLDTKVYTWLREIIGKEQDVLWHIADRATHKEVLCTTRKRRMLRSF
ncbi:unnamed protein product [Arabis nemorensis]|uniref:Retrotransposon gag domain-containing protein n=1 Tax=Arabis nemorensis TaxID=586526 RepID=A0A565AU20_9BRAS|nr:unnamed protein product [Arabis nemorensis]